MGVHLRRDLSEEGQGRRAGHALVRHPGDAGASGEISAAVAPGAHAVLMLDQAGWHMSAKLAVPANVTLLPLPPRSPELNPVENIWQFIRDNWLSNRKRDGVALCGEA